MLILRQSSDNMSCSKVPSDLIEYSRCVMAVMQDGWLVLKETLMWEGGPPEYIMLSLSLFSSPHISLLSLLVLLVLSSAKHPPRFISLSFSKNWNRKIMVSFLCGCISTTQTDSNDPRSIFAVIFWMYANVRPDANVHVWHFWRHDTMWSPAFQLFVGIAGLTYSRIDAINVLFMP